MKNPNFFTALTKIGKFLPLVFSFIFSGFGATAQLTADFTSSPNAGCAPLVVKFADSSSGNPTSWRWDLGNGTSSVLQNPSVAYFEPGTYTVKLVIKNAFGVDSLTKVKFITVYTAPVINLKASDLTGCFPLTTRFTDLSFPGSGNITKWEWDFGDGNLSSDQNPQHTYTSAGDFNVSLRAINNFGCVSSKTITSLIHITTGVKADFSNSTSKTCNAPAAINFSNKSTGTGTLNYHWDFGDGSTSLSANPSHTYDVSGSFTVSLIVTNATGCTDTLVKPHLINVGNTMADFSLPSAICVGNPVIFKNTSNPVPASATWNFGDGTFSDSTEPVKAFYKPGDYTVKMISNNGACKDSISKTISVLSKPKVAFSAQQTVSCAAPFNVSFINLSSPAARKFNNEDAEVYYWDFGDGTHSNNKVPSHVYSKEGIYTVKLFVTSAAGCTDSIIKKDFIKIKAPVVAIKNLPQRGCAPLSHKFTSVVNSLVPVTNFHWDFGDGSSSDSSEPTHVYTTPGKYSITLTYTTEGGCIDSVKVFNGIIIGSKPATSFSADPLNTCAFTPINFNDQTSGNPDQWIWFFGDGSSSTSQNPSHRYNDTGFFNITLIALNDGCPDTLTSKGKIHINPPVSRFIYTKTCSIPSKVIFTDKSLGADYWHWDLGDGNTSNDKSPVHEYPNPGTYIVSLTVTNQSTGCSETKADTVKIIHEVADFQVNNPESCRNTPVSFSAINNIPGNISSYSWNFGDGISASGSKVSHQYTKANAYDIRLIIKDIYGCSDTLSKPLAVQINGPTARFQSTVSGTCLNNTVEFSDSSYSDGQHPIQQYTWNWGDGKTENLTGSPFNHAYSAAKKYSVSLVVTDSKGCTDTLKKPDMIIVSKPVAAFSSDTLSCTSKPINFVNSSSGPGLIYTWDFGDGSTSSAKNPVHLYATEGTYEVSLSLKDQYGCSSSVSKANYVTIGDPKADFTVSDTIGTCPPLVANFTNNSENYSKWSWDFGDGTTSAERTPSHFYSSAGTFDAVLTVTGPGGCISQKSQHIKIDGPSGSFTYNNIMGCNPLKTDFVAHTKKNISFVWDFNDGNTISTTDSNVTHSYLTRGNYLPKMILQDAKGCQVAIRGSDSITIFGVTASYSHNGALICDSGSVAFTNTSISNDVIGNYYWNFGDGTSSHDSKPSHSYTRPGTYPTSLVVTTQKGCIDSIKNPISVQVNRSPRISIKSSEGACVPATITFAGILSNPDTSSVSWKWDFANGNVSADKNPASQIYPSAGNFTVKAIGTSSNGCSFTATKLIEIYPLPVLKVDADSIVCYGAPQTLRATGAQSYSWSPAKYLSCENCATPVSRPDSNVSYRVKGTNAKGCVSSNSVSLRIKYPFKLLYSKADTVCAGSSVQLKTSGAEKYSWYPASGLNNANISSPLASPQNSTRYQVIASDSKGCFRDTAYIPVKVYPIPVVKAGNAQTISVGREIQITPEISSDVTDVSWFPSTGIMDRKYPSITVKPIQSLEYTIRAKNAGGCTAEDKVAVYVLCDNANIFVPNTFSPNGDGTNDIFYPRGSGIFKILSIKVFSRWGEVVFEKSNFSANDQSAGWNGSFKGKQLPSDVFVYIMQVLCDNNSTLTFKGNIALIR